MQNNCTTSDRFKRLVFQRCRLLLVVNVKKKHTQCKYATLYGYETVARWAIILHTPVPCWEIHVYMILYIRNPAKMLGRMTYLTARQLYHDIYWCVCDVFLLLVRQEGVRHAVVKHARPLLFHVFNSASTTPLRATEIPVTQNMQCYAGTQDICTIEMYGIGPECFT